MILIHKTGTPYTLKLALEMPLLSLKYFAWQIDFQIWQVRLFGDCYLVVS